MSLSSFFSITMQLGDLSNANITAWKIFSMGSNGIWTNVTVPLNSTVVFRRYSCTCGNGIVEVPEVKENFFSLFISFSNVMVVPVVVVTANFILQLNLVTLSSVLIVLVIQMFALPQTLTVHHQVSILPNYTQ